MTPIDQPPALKHYYQDRAVVDSYTERRIGQPLNGLLHRRQVEFLNRMVGERSPHTLLEVACGPGRLTAEIRGVRRGIAVDASPAMLEVAGQRTNGATAHWSFVRTDAFVLPFRSEAFDAAYTLRFIRHFQLEDRHRLYTEVHRVLRRRGVFVIDALNRDVSLPYRRKRGLDRYPIYDALYRREEIEAELRSAGFRVVCVEGLIKHYPVQRLFNRLRRVKLDRIATAVIASIEHLPGRHPSSWMLLCEKEGDSGTTPSAALTGCGGS
ncbi:MAG: class I SAM-dependent methyltransferase [Candidatus Binatia bacterium]